MEQSHGNVGTERDATTGARPAPAATGTGWPQRLRHIGSRILDRYPELPPASNSWGARAALVVVALLAAAFATFFILNVSLLHSAYATHAEDLGIYDQAMWNAVNPHGQFFHQTICDTVGDTNCLGSVVRTAIHFEPILVLVAPFYAIFPSPLTLVVIQALVVASGAFPAHWIASRRLGSQLAGVAFAALYLAFPALQSAVGSDFHAVTLSAAFVLFALYFMLSRNDVGLWVFSILAMTTKEEVPLLVFMIGLSIALLQRRWRLGLSLAGVAVAYLGLALVVLHLSSPVGHSPTADRYAYLGGTPTKAALFILTHPLLVLRHYLLAPDRIDYLRKLLAPTGYLAVLSPLTLLIAGPELAINMLSADPIMHSATDQYNADIVPVIVFASIESVALLGAVAGWLVARLPIRFGVTGQPAPAAALATAGAANPLSEAAPGSSARFSALARRSDGQRGRTIAALSARVRSGWPATFISIPRLVIAAAVLVAFLIGARATYLRGQTPLTWGFHWPTVTAHDNLAASFIAMIPPDASVSAQTDLVPHLSQRRLIYLFPDRADTADYVFLDVTANTFPLQNTPDAYVARVRALLASGAYHVAAARDGYLLLARGSGAGRAPTPGDPNGLPASFYSFSQAPAAPPHALAVQFGPSLELVGYDVQPARDTNLNINSLRVATYWRVTGPVPAGLRPQLIFASPDGRVTIDDDLPTAQWLPAGRWPTGQTILVASRPIAPITGAGLLRFGVRVIQSSGDTSTPLIPLPGTIESPSAPGQVTPQLDSATGAVLFAGEQVMP